MQSCNGCILTVSLQESPVRGRALTLRGLSIVAIVHQNHLSDLCVLMHDVWLADCKRDVAIPFGHVSIGLGILTLSWAELWPTNIQALLAWCECFSKAQHADSSFRVTAVGITSGHSNMKQVQSLQHNGPLITTHDEYRASYNYGMGISLLWYLGKCLKSNV